MISLDIRTKERRSMPATLPALNLIAEPGCRRATLDTAREIERRGFAGISVSSSFGNMSQSVGLALATERIPFATAIAPIYAQSVDEFAQNAAYLHEVSGGRFQFGIGIAHAPAYVRMEAKPGKPLSALPGPISRVYPAAERGWWRRGVPAISPAAAVPHLTRGNSFAEQVGSGACGL